MPLINGFADELLVEAGPTGAHSVLQIIQTHDSSHRTTRYFCQLFNRLLLYPCGLPDCLSVQLHDQYSVPFRRPRPSTTGLPRERIGCVNLVQKISDCPILVRKLFTNAFWTPSLILTKEFNRQFIFIRERHVYQQIVT